MFLFSKTSSYCLFTGKIRKKNLWPLILNMSIVNICFNKNAESFIHNFYKLFWYNFTSLWIFNKNNDFFFVPKFVQYRNCLTAAVRWPSSVRVRPLHRYFSWHLLVFHFHSSSVMFLWIHYIMVLSVITSSINSRHWNSCSDTD